MVKDPTVVQINTKIAVYPYLVLLLASFLEGGAVMVIELLGAKIVAPYYGTSLYVWASVLGVTIGALAAGYFLGGRLSKYSNNAKKLYLLFGLGAAFTFMLPFTAEFLLPLTFSLNLQLGVTLALLLYLFPPVMCMGAISPVIIQMLYNFNKGAGRSTGWVYAISTCGGILATLLTSFYWIPSIGIFNTTMIAGSILAITAFVVFYNRKQFKVKVFLSGIIPLKNKSYKTQKITKASTLPVALLLTISFLEGGALMIAELLGAKITAPYYGSSLYVWGAVLAVTLSALALGYYIGGYISNKKNLERNLFILLMIGAFLTAIGPLVGPTILMNTDFLGVQLGALVSVVCYLFPPVVCMGMVSPIITQLISPKIKTGQAAGTVYAISTVGGILATFLSGFLLIPTLGIKTMAFLTGGLLGLLAIVYFTYHKKYSLVMLGLVFALVTVILLPRSKESDTTRVVYNSTGILGEWTILDFGQWKVENNGQIERKLLLNGIDQTYTQIDFEPLSLWRYPHKIAAYSSMKPKGSKALLLGMGGGSIAFELLAMEMDLDIVELDPRVKHIAETYFNYKPESSDLYIDDARHFIRTTSEKYDIVILDLVLGEVQPAHVFSMEGFADLKKIIKKDAFVIINFQGNIYDPRYSIGPRSIYKTLEASGFNVSLYSPPPTEAVKKSLTKDIFFIASQVEHNYKHLMQNLRYNAWFPYDDFYYDDLIREVEFSLEDAHVLVDDKPMLELLTAPTILKWRQNKVQQNIKRMMKEGIPIYD